jgi:2-dehydropantoate 2-reductase
MRVLVVGAGVIGSVYGAHLATGGETVDVLGHGQRTRDVARNGLVTRDALDGRMLQAQVSVIADPGAAVYDVVLVALRREQIAAALFELGTLSGEPAVVLFGNNPLGRSVAPGYIASEVRLGFPGVGGVMVDGVAEYVRIPQQPTALETTRDPRLDALEHTLRRERFGVQRVRDMDGWLAYHAVFVSCIAAALYRCGTDPVRLASDRTTLGLMCRAITEGFFALRAQGTGGLPRNLAILHHPLLGWFAAKYWARTMRSRMGELCFGAHARHAQAEMESLADDVLVRVGGRNGTAALRLLLDRSSSPGH